MRILLLRCSCPGPAVAHLHPFPTPWPALCPTQVEALSVEGVCQAMAAYSLSIPAAVPSRDMALAELRWRNGWFLQRARTPAHVAWLARAGVQV